MIENIPYHFVTYMIWNFGIAILIITSLCIILKMTYDYADEQNHRELWPKILKIWMFPFNIIFNLNLEEIYEKISKKDRGHTNIEILWLGLPFVAYSMAFIWPLTIVILIFAGIGKLLRFIFRVKKVVDKISEDLKSHTEDPDAHK